MTESWNNLPSLGPDRRHGTNNSRIILNQKKGGKFRKNWGFRGGNGSGGGLPGSEKFGKTPQKTRGPPQRTNKNPRGGNPHRGVPQPRGKPGKKDPPTAGFLLAGEKNPRKGGPPGVYYFLGAPAGRDSKRPEGSFGGDGGPPGGETPGGARKEISAREGVSHTKRVDTWFSCFKKKKLFGARTNKKRGARI